jgi:hypothetical protein
MRLRNALHLAATMTLAVLETSPSAASDEEPSIVREAAVTIPAETIQSWVGAECGEQILVPWFDGSELAAKVASVEAGERYTTVVGEVDAKIIGNLLLTIGDGVAGALTIDSEVYRLRTLGDDQYSLVQYDPNLLSPDHLDTNLDGPSAAPARPHALSQTKQGRFLSGISVRNLVDRVIAQLDPGDALYENGERIDILVAVTESAAAWAQSEGYDLDAEIENLIGVTNLVYARSAIVPRLRLVGTTTVEYSVQQPEKLEVDAFDLSAGTGNLQELHDLRDQTGADLVSLLVLNGTTCYGVPLACGYGFTQREHAGPGDAPGSASWEANFAAEGFSVVSIYAAFNAHTFTHEVSHNLGAHHDWYSFAIDGYAPTVDAFARGWILVGGGFRTLMAYNRLCELGGLGNAPDTSFCDLLPTLSNPLQSYLGERRGDPPPGLPPTFLGPADNKTAVNRMARTVASYRISLP